MTERKRPDFDEASGIMIVQDMARPMKWDASFSVGDQVSVKYKGKNVDMIVVAILSDHEAVGRIRGFETISTEFEDLAQDEEAIFEKRHVWGITK